MRTPLVVSLTEFRQTLSRMLCGTADVPLYNTEVTDQGIRLLSSELPSAMIIY